MDNNNLLNGQADDQKEMLNEKLSKLSAADLELLRQKIRLERQGKERKPDLGVVAVPGTIYPCTLAQQQLWFLHRYDPKDDSYHFCLGFHIQGQLDIHALEAAFQSLVKRHPSIRTTFFENDGELYQRVHPYSGYELFREYVQELTEPEKTLKVQALIEHFRQKPFDLETEFPVRAMLLCLEEASYILVIVSHHIQSDGQSKVQFLTQLSDFYHQHKKSGTAVFGELLRHPGEWALEERTFLATEEARRHMDHWLPELKKGGLDFRWPFEDQFSVENPGQSMAGQKFMDLDEALIAALRELARKNGVTFFGVMLATYFLLLQRHLGGRVLTIGVPFQHRKGLNDEDLIGYRMNMLPVTMDWVPNKSFRESLLTLHHKIEEGFRHQDLPFGKMLQLLHEQDPGFDFKRIKTLFNYREDVWKSLRLDGSTIEEFPIRLGRANADLNIFIERLDDREPGKGLRVNLRFDRSVITEENASALSRRWLRILQQCVRNPDASLKSFDICDIIDLERLSAWSRGPQMALPEIPLIHAIFRQQARRNPGNMAVIAEDGSLTYSELDLASDRLAAFLMASGIMPDQPVGLFMERSYRMMVAILGILKAGGAFLALDVYNPEERIAFMIEDSGLRLLLTDKPNSIRLANNVSIIDIEIAIQKASSMSTEDVPDHFQDPSSLAYVVYTSGSTGKPKGAMVEHRGIVNRLTYARNLMGFESHHRSLQKSPLSFDVCMTELFLPLVAGGAVVFAPPERVVLPEHIVDLVCRYAVSYVHFVPSMLKAFLQVPSVEKVNGHLKFIRCGGEALTRPIMEDCLSKLDAVLYQSYGPAEAAVSVTTWECRIGMDHPHPPIGKPNANTVIRILDTYGMPVPSGMTGEIWIGGIQVGRGYINQPELTSERFLTDPLDATSGMRFYRTGDLGRFLEDGNIKFSGRNDDQVKISGQRIEPEEVASVLRLCEGVSQAVISAEKDSGGDHVLIAYLVIDEESFNGVERLKAELSRHLPPYMIPSRYYVLPDIPLTGHGKTDMHALRSAVKSELQPQVEFMAPVTPMEQKLAAIWSEMLNRDRIGLHDNFFSLGGHSMLALRMISRIRKETGVILDLSAFYEKTNLSALASHLDDGSGSANRNVPVRASIGTRIPMSYSQKRMWVMQQTLREPSAYHISRLLFFDVTLDTGTLKKALRILSVHHDILRTRLSYKEDFFAQETDDPEGWTFPFKEVMIGSEEQSTIPISSDILYQERNRPFQHDREPLWRAVLVHSPADKQLLLTFHHAIMDEWSIQIFFNELKALMESDGDPVKAGVHAPQWRYADFTYSQQVLLDGGERERQKAFWSMKLSGLSEVMQIPYDRHSSEIDRGPNGMVKFSICKETVERVLMLCDRERQSRFSILFSAFIVLLHRYSGSLDIVVSSPISERKLPEWQDILGLFLNTLPLRMQVDPEICFLDFFRQAGMELQAMFDHADLPFEEISMLREDNVNVSNAGLYNVMFTIVHQGNTIQDTDVGFDEGKLSAGFAKNDLTCFIHPEGEEWDCWFNYDSARFTHARMETLASIFKRLIRQMVETPEIPLRNLSLLDDEERKRILSMSMGPITTLPDRPYIHEVFELQVKKTPFNTALFHKGITITYDGLNRMANRWAFELINRYDVGREEILPVILPKGPLLVTSILAILKSGAAFLPIDPDLPSDRIRFMLEDSAARFMISDRKIFDQKQTGIGLIDVDQFDLNAPDQNIGLKQEGNPLAYCLYTSGSTGKPKGALIPHQGFVSMITALIRDFGATETDRFMQMASPSFDMSLLETFPALFSGAALYITDDIELNRVGDWIRDHAITMAMMTPSFIAVLETEVFASLRMLMSAGEAARVADVRRLSKRLKFFNGYGPTETTVISTYCDLSDIEHPNDPLPIGKPIDNSANVVLDTLGRLTPVGMPGELHISGIGLARGYLNRMDLTHEKFIENPFIPGERLYKTGDLACWTEEGKLLFLGRLDHQVKVRGFRIELDEVSIVMQECNGIRDAVLLAEKDGLGNTQLEAYVLTDEKSFKGLDALRAELSSRLPYYMIPAHIIVVPYMPVNSNGKTDRLALHNMASLQSASSVMDEAPASSVEKRLASIWCEQLNREKVGRHDDFFSLGGHSLHLIYIMSMVRAVFGVEIDLRTFYHSSRLLDMARMIEDASGMKAKESKELDFSPTLIYKGRGNQHIYISIGGTGSMEGFSKYRMMGEWLGGDYHLFALADPEASMGCKPTIPVEELGRRFALSILDHHPKGPYILLGECTGGIDSFFIATALQKMTDAPISLFMLDSLGPDMNHVKGLVKETVHPLAYSNGSKILSRARVWVNKWMKPEQPMEKPSNILLRKYRKLKSEAISFALFDEAWYLKMNPDVAVSGYDPFVQYMHTGWREKRAPAAHFNLLFYQEIYPDFDPMTQNPILHFLSVGRAVGSVLSYVRKLPFLYDKMKRIVAAYQLFDENWYLMKNPDVQLWGRDPFHHYMIEGYKELRSPSPFFTSAIYHLLCPQYEKRRQNPVLHFVLYGIDDPLVERKVRELYLTPSQKNRIAHHGLFDARWYLSSYPSVAHYGHDALTHYHTIGWRIGRKPFEGFDLDSYASLHDDFHRTDANPLLHMLDHLTDTGSILAGEKTTVLNRSMPKQPVSADTREEQELMNARTLLRKGVHMSSTFNGNAYLISSFFLHAEDPALGWKRFIKGPLKTFRAAGDHEGYLWEDLRTNTELIAGCLSENGR